MPIRLPIKNTDQEYEINPSKIIGLGMNYYQDVENKDNTNIPDEPILFAKTPNVLIGNGENIVFPSFFKDYDFKKQRVEYEAELAFIMKSQCKNVASEAAYDYIYGFTCMNDISHRNFQEKDVAGWFRGKSIDTFGPIGPQIVLTDDIGDAHDLNIKCRLNGKVVQDSNTRHMIFSIQEMIQFISKNFTLHEGDIVTTGTPPGMGNLKSGDHVEVEVEGIGILENYVIEEGE